MDIEKSQALLAAAEVILLPHVSPAPGTNESTPSLRVINIEPVTARKTFVNLDIKVTVVDHMPETAFAAHHDTPPFRL
jgi:hypothetical protein